MRKTAIGVLCNFYPIFVVLHLIYGDWCRKCQLLFNIVPIAVFGGLLFIWKDYSYVKLSGIEKYFIGYLILMITVVYTYYIICVFSTSKWVYSHNVQFSAFIAITGIYYFYALYNAKR